MSEKLSELRRWVKDAVDGGFTPVTIPTSDLVFLFKRIDELENEKVDLSYRLQREFYVSEQLEKKVEEYEKVLLKKWELKQEGKD